MKRKKPAGRARYVVGYRVSFRPADDAAPADVRVFWCARYPSAIALAGLYYHALRTLCPRASITTDYVWEEVPSR